MYSVTLKTKTHKIPYPIRLNVAAKAEAYLNGLAPPPETETFSEGAYGTFSLELKWRELLKPDQYNSRRGIVKPVDRVSALGKRLGLSVIEEKEKEPLKVFPLAFRDGDFVADGGGNAILARRVVNQPISEIAQHGALLDYHTHYVCTLDTPITDKYKDCQVPQLDLQARCWRYHDGTEQRMSSVPAGINANANGLRAFGFDYKLLKKLLLKYCGISNYMAFQWRLAKYTNKVSKQVSYFLELHDDEGLVISLADFRLSPGSYS